MVRGQAHGVHRMVEADDVVVRRMPPEPLLERERRSISAMNLSKYVSWCRPPLSAPIAGRLGPPGCPGRRTSRCSSRCPGARAGRSRLLPAARRGSSPLKVSPGPAASTGRAPFRRGDSAGREELEVDTVRDGAGPAGQVRRRPLGYGRVGRGSWRPPRRRGGGG